MNKDPNLFVEVFNQRAGILTFFGALGGSVRAVVLKTTWKEGLRVVFVGGAVAFGVGVLAPVVLSPYIGDIPNDMAGTLGTLTAASFIIGLIAVTLLERFISGRDLAKGTFYGHDSIHKINHNNNSNNESYNPDER